MQGKYHTYGNSSITGTESRLWGTIWNYLFSAPVYLLPRGAFGNVSTKDFNGTIKDCVSRRGSSFLQSVLGFLRYDIYIQSKKFASPGWSLVTANWYHAFYSWLLTEHILKTCFLLKHFDNWALLAIQIYLDTLSYWLPTGRRAYFTNMG